MMDDSLQRTAIACALPSALEAVGERWSFLILRAAFSGLGHFEEFQSTLGIARNILANRLARLVEHGILSRSPCADDRRKIEYRLTEKGEALLPTLLALRQWGERWGCGTLSNPVLVDTRDSMPVGEVTVRAHDDRVLRFGELRWADRSELTTAANERPRDVTPVK
jgi:DNA-binding HxlR family transcriptional regulator